MNKKWLGLSAILCMVNVNATVLEEKTTSLTDQRKLSLTIYNDDLALVKDQRKVNLAAGMNRLAWRDVSARIRPETALLHSLNEVGGLRVLEQNFDFDVLTPQKLLEKNVGNTVMVIKTNPATGAETRETATILGAKEGVVLKFGDHIETSAPGRLAFASLPDNLHDRPTLMMTVANSQAGISALELSYLTAGLSWHADYVAELSAQENKMDINAWVTVTNQSGVNYANAKLQFVAGNVNRVRENLQPEMAMRSAVMAKSADTPMAQENLFEYHLYSLDRSINLADQQSKQFALLSAAQIPVKKSLELHGTEYYYRDSAPDLGAKLRAEIFMTFANKGAGLGVPLPKGVMRLYKKDKVGNAQFIGEDVLDHTANGDSVRLKLGDAFDVYADKKQTEFQKLISGPNDYILESAYQITVKNTGTEAVTVKVYEPIPGDWKILSESITHSKVAAGTALWQVRIPATASTVLTYRVRVKL